MIVNKAIATLIFEIQEPLLVDDIHGFWIFGEETQVSPISSRP
jgi:hypothetical protein